MFIVFEGIDGSGKTTISNRVVARLRASGLSVAHVREQGTFTSPTAQAIRELCRDARNLMLTPLSELMLYLARDGQSLEEVTLPALAHADVVIADRYVYSAELLATAVRGLPADVVARIVDPLKARAVPDLAILVDVPPDIARARRRVSKLHAPAVRSPSRKGLAGGGLHAKMRRAHLALAEQDPARWLIVDNDDVDLDEVVAALAGAITTAVRRGVAAGLDEGRRRLPRSTPLPSGLRSAADARAALLDWIERRAVREPDVAAYMLAGLAGDDMTAWRRALADRSPIIVAHGLAGLDDAASWRLRDDLVERAPCAVARSLDGLASVAAYRRRRQLAHHVPEAVIASLGGLDDDDAWALRFKLRGEHPDAVAASLAKVLSPRAELERRAWLDAVGKRGPTDYAQARAGAKMVAGLDDELGWQIRDLVVGLAPVDAIASTVGGDSERAWRWRAQYSERAPRPVIDSLSGMTQQAAWSLRQALARTCREVFHSMIGLDGAHAWALRERHADAWPSTVCHSLGALATSERGVALVSTLLARHVGVSLVRNAAKACVSSIREPGATGTAYRMHNEAVCRTPTFRPSSSIRRS